MLNDLYFEEFPELESQRLLLRQLNLSDASEVQGIRSDERVMVYMDQERHLSLQQSEESISKKLKLYKERTGMLWALIEKSTGKFIGDFAFFNIDPKNSRAEIGYTLKPEFWKKGLMKEAMMCIFNFGFKKFNLHSLEANINPGNDNSRGLLTSMGFQKEAYFRENYFYNGEYLDSEIYSLLQSDFYKGLKK
ncbi:GNAT family N-acetyltransferase [Psychroflexus sp. YR1-1]|uniref:GNAT family N-acetyltransferase n=1 Tax=Psychroflexus aurantiacus TaxID=2709310 RepID=A0A6B3R0N7_9FLAO|nr:GNAT family N-acetyltransferase [Psychroflexus aurantiacus]NEV92970.1 GNAT family N-acetyltransferase [Psychroflexus aurantiacus]